MVCCKCNKVLTADTARHCPECGSDYCTECAKQLCDCYNELKYYS